MTIRVRLTLAYGAALGGTLLLVVVGVWWMFGGALRGALDQTLLERAISVLATIENDSTAGLQEVDQPHTDVTAAIFDAQGRLVDASPDYPVGLEATAPSGDWDMTIGDVAYAVMARRSDTGMRVVVATRLAPIEARQGELARVLAMAGFLGASASMLAGWWLAGRALRPVDLMTRDAATFSVVDLERRLPDPGTADELGRLARTLNAMLDRLTDGLRHQTAFMLAASHDLRTPLSALRADLELAARPGSSEAELRAAVNAAHLDVIHLGDLAAALLDLASTGQRGRAIVRTTVSIAELVDGAVRQTAALARWRRVTVAASADCGEIDIDRVRLGQALANLLNNAIVHGPADARVIVKGRIERAHGSGGGSLELDVVDDGPGIPEAVRAALFLPFQRGPEAVSTGHGLGLAIADAAVRAHGGSLTLEPGSDGGTLARIRIPVPGS